MADQYTPLPVKTKGTADVSVRLRNVADTAYMGDNTTPLQVGDGGGSLTIDSPGVPTALGQSTMANSMRVTLASDQSSLAVTVGNASLPVTQSGTWTVGLTNDWTLVDNAGFTDGTTRLGMAGYIFDETAGTALTENDAAAARIDSKRAQVLVLEDATTRGQRAAISAAGRLSVDGSGVTQPVSGTVTGNQGTAAAGSGAWPVTVTTTGDTVVKPGDSGNNAIRVNVVAGGGTTAPTTPTRSYQTISALAISTRTAINFAELGAAGASGRLAQLIMASTVTCKWELFTLTNAVESGSALAVFFTTSANPTLVYNTPHPNYIQIAASAGADNFRLYATNLDNSLAADVYATAMWDFV